MPQLLETAPREGQAALKHQKRQKKVNKNLLAPLAVYGGKQANATKGKKLPELFPGNQVRAIHHKTEMPDLMRSTLPPKPSQVVQAASSEVMHPLGAKTMSSKETAQVQHHAMAAIQSQQFVPAVRGD